MTIARSPVTLIGEEIAGDWNVTALADGARWIGGTYFNSPEIAQSTEAELEATGRDQNLRLDPLGQFDWLIAAENIPNAADIYSYRLPPGILRPALIVGNEAKGLRRRTHRRANVTVQIPTVSKHINCLNVAAAAAVMLAYLGLERPLPYPRRTLSAVQRMRPDLLLSGGADHRELGSAIRSATAFGWDTVLLKDRYAAWFDADRAVRDEGRGMARRGRNPIHVVPFTETLAASYRRIVIVTHEARGRSLFSLPLTGGDTLLAMADEGDGNPNWLPSVGSRNEVVYASLPPIPTSCYHFRQTVSLALAEAARQLGRPDTDGITLRSKRNRYRREATADAIALPRADIVDLS